MMYKCLYILLIYFLNVLPAFSQTVISSCIAPDSIIAKYNNDADRLAVRKFHRNSLPEKDSIIIPTAHSDTVLKALIAVYNAVGLAERDTVINFFDIHSFPKLSLHLFEITADTNLYWVQKIKNGIIPTGDVIIDNIMSDYYLYIQSYSQASSQPWAFINFQTDTNYNIPAFSNLFDTLPGVYFFYPIGMGGDGNDITDSIHSTHVELIYSYGWGDCLAGCICRRYWKFEVDFNCNVSFSGSYVNFPSYCNFPFTGIQDNERHELISVEPNPFSDHLFVKDMVRFNYNICDITGKKIIEGKTVNSKIENLEFLKPGIYFLKILNDKKSVTLKILKE